MHRHIIRLKIRAEVAGLPARMLWSDGSDFLARRPTRLTSIAELAASVFDWTRHCHGRNLEGGYAACYFKLSDLPPYATTESSSPGREPKP